MNSSICPNNNREDIKKDISIKFNLGIIAVGLFLLRSYYLSSKLFDLIILSGLSLLANKGGL
jgi:hypothetical protein